VVLEKGTDPGRGRRPEGNSQVERNPTEGNAAFFAISRRVKALFKTGKTQGCGPNTAKEKTTAVKRGPGQKRGRGIPPKKALKTEGNRPG